MMIGAPEDEVITGALASARQHGLAHELLDRAGVRELAPGFALPEHHVAVWEPRAGALDPERCIATHLRLAEQHGATLRFDERVDRWTPDGAGVSIITDQGEYRADRLILSAGAWTSDFNQKLALPLRVTRHVVYWFDPVRNADHFDPDRFPVFVWHLPGDTTIYGLPNLGAGVKAGVHDAIEETDPDSIDRAVAPSEIEAMRERFATYLPDAAGTFRKAEVCIYTSTPDGHFLLDFHHRHPQVILANPCSGHGFKFASAVGEVLADMVVDGQSTFDLGLFGLSRLLPAES
ncbi:MAG TPA: N-methyl-L-tryptophan oxidase, partial [Dehalococcoidia bacterium]|nr:N-methyl-L-tryptophan oxidase [Dehalococcoidia bacterium]